MIYFFLAIVELAILVSFNAFGAWATYDLGDDQYCHRAYLKMEKASADGHPYAMTCEPPIWALEAAKWLAIHI